MPLDAAVARGYSKWVMAGGSAPRASRTGDPSDANRPSDDGAPASGIEVADQGIHEVHPRAATSDAPIEGDDASAPSSGANRRSARRVDVEWSVDCTTEDTFLYASITNISAIGIFVRTESPLQAGTQLTLRFSPRTGAGVAAFEAGAEPSGELVLRGSVQWVNHVRPGGDNPNPGMGIRFIDLAPSERERLVETVRSIAYLREDAAAN